MIRMNGFGRTPVKLLIKVIRCACLVAVFSPMVFCQTSPAEDVFRSAIRERQIDLAACGLVSGGEFVPAQAEQVQLVLGFVRPSNQSWRPPRAEGKEARACRYRIGFREPIAIGSLWVSGTPNDIAYLRDAADFPGDPANLEHWQSVAVPPRQPDTKVVAFPPGVKTRAILLTDRDNAGNSRLDLLRIFPARLHTVTREASAHADESYTAFSSAGPPFTYRPSLVVEGGREWINTGKNQQGQITRPAISELYPSWFLLAWREPKVISGLVLQDTLKSFDLEYFDGPEHVNPKAGVAREWKRIKDIDQIATPIHRWQHRSVSFEPVTTRGLRIRITGSHEGAIARIAALHACIDLGERPAPKSPAEDVADSVPARIPITLPDDGYLTVAVDDANGHRVRNLIARKKLSGGTHQIGWDLKDESGVAVSPGKFRFKAIYHPGLHHRYEMTVYPNLSQHAPENAPWLTEMSGPDGWMADHSPPRAACVAGDRVYLGSPVSESGVSLIECDLSGRKRWGHHSFAGFTGAWLLAADADNVYVAANAGNTAAAWGVDTSTEAIWAIDHKSKQVREVARLEPTDTRKRGMQGMAASDGRIYLSVRGDDRWLNNAAGLANVDFEHCIPRHSPKRQPRFAYEIVPDPQGDFARLFRLTGTPPGGAAGAGGLIWLGSESTASSRAFLVLAFDRPVELGSVVYPVPQGVDYKVKLSVLKEGAAYPPDPARSDDWRDFSSHGKLPWDVAVAPEETKTRALRIMFYQGEDDLLAELAAGKDAPNLDDVLERKNKKTSGLDFGNARWTGRLEGMKLLRRRYQNLAETAQVRVNSGRVDRTGEWDAGRSRPLSESDPGIYVLQWDAPQSIRGLAIKEIDGKRTKIDVYTGSPSDQIDIDAADGWQEVAEYEQERRDHHSGFPSYNGKARYLDGYVDFGESIETRAVRLRVVEQWADNLPDARGIRDDLGGTNLDPARCRVFGVAVLGYIGGEPPIDRRANHRIEVIEAASGEVAGDVTIEDPGAIAVGPKGDLYAVAGRDIVRVDLGDGRHTPIVTGLDQPGPLALDKAGNLYVFEGEPDHQNIKVFGPDGKPLREIGTRGGYQLGDWDPTRFGNLTALAIDEQNQIWAVADNYFPKRIAVWTTDGTYKKEFLGNTAYGGGGMLDPTDRRRLYYGPLEFELDWETGESRLKKLLTRDFHHELAPIHLDGRQTMVTSPEFIQQGCGIVYRYEKDRLIQAAAVGRADAFKPLATPAIHAALGSVMLKVHLFSWSDTNGDGEVQADEVDLFKTPQNAGAVTNFGRDLAITAGPVVWEVANFLPSGVPVYKHSVLPIDAHYTLRTADGNYLCFGFAEREPERLVTPSGETLWTVASEGAGTGGLTRAAPYSEEQIVAQFGWVGHETAAKGDLGEFVVIHGNTGTWHILTTDGLLAGRIFTDQRAAKARTWSMPEHDRGMSLDGVTIGQEHFRGYFCRTADGKYYAVAGHNHVSLVEIEGIDKFQRFSGELEISSDVVAQTQLAAQARHKELAFYEAPVIDCFRLREPPQIDGNLGEWTGDAAAEFGEQDEVSGQMFRGARLHAGFDETHLYLAYDVIGLGPLKNSGENWDRLFKTGAALDLKMSTIPEAPEDRRHPVVGDFRLLMTITDGKPRAVLYRAVVPGTPASKAWHVVSPTGEASFDQVVELRDVEMAVQSNSGGYRFEAAVPRRTIGLEIRPGTRLKIDWGVLESDEDGNAVLRRMYWANKATAIVADIPSEARLHPDLWGHVLFHDRAADKAAEFLQTTDLDKRGKPDLVKELLDELDD